MKTVTQLELLEIKKRNSKDVPAIENYDVMIYLSMVPALWAMASGYDVIGLNFNGVLDFWVHQANHIIDVELVRVPESTYRFINIL